MNGSNHLNWQDVRRHNDPNEMRADWLNLLMPLTDKHAPSKTKRIGKRESPWITPDVVQKVRLRYFLRKQFHVTRDNEIW